MSAFTLPRWQGFQQLQLQLQPQPQPQPQRSAPSPQRVDALTTLWSLLGFSVGALICFALAASTDTRQLDGANVWLKPAKFALSFLVLYLTLIGVVQRLSDAAQTGRGLRAALQIMVVATWFELAYIGGRAGMGQRSHFAQDTPLETALYSLMGLGALSLVAGIGYIGWVVARDASARMGPALKLGVKWGFAISSVLTLITAGYLSSSGGHFVGTPSAGAATVPLLGWSAEVGDLRPAHFFALHAMQVLPLVGWCIDQKGPLKATHMHGFALAYMAICGAVFVQALAGLPLVRF